MRRALLAVVLVLGCGEGVAPVRAGGAAAGEASVRDRLSLEYALFGVLPMASQGSVVARRTLAGEEAQLALRASDGRFFAQAGLAPAGTVLDLKAAQVALDSVVATAAQVPPAGLTLVDVAFTLQAPQALPLRWYGDGSVGFAEGPARFRFTSKLLLSNGATSPLEVGFLDAQVQVLIVDRGGALALSFELQRAGQVWDWAGMFQLRDLGLHVEALQLTPQDQPPLDPVLE